MTLATDTDQRFYTDIREHAPPPPKRADRRLSEALPVYAASDQDVCGVDM